MNGSIPAGALGELIERLAKVRSPLERMRLVARSWRQLRSLEPAERRRLADAVGLEGAERVIERIARRKVPVAEVVRSLAGAREDDARPLSSLVDDLRDPEGRRRLARRGRDLAVERLAPDPPSEPEPPQEIPDATTPLTEHAAPALPEPPLAPEPPPVREPAPVRERIEPAAEEALPGAPVEEPEDAPAERSRETLVPRVPHPRSTSPLGWLRDLRDDLAVGEPMTVETLRDRVGEVGQAWVRRRAIQAAIDAGVVRSVDDLQRLADLLGRDADRRWCTLTLLERGEVDRSDLLRLAVEHSDPTVRRRAGRRAGV